MLCLLLSVYSAPGFAERADREKPINIEADSVTVDDSKQTSTFEGNVQMRQGTLSIEAAKIVVMQDSKGYSHIVASGQPAHLRQKHDISNEYTEGFGERIEYDNYAEIANFYGQARVKREGDDVRGEHIVYNTKTGVFQVFGSKDKTADTTGAPGKGRVTIVIQPKEKSNETAQDPKSQPAQPATSPSLPQP